MKAVSQVMLLCLMLGSARASLADSLGTTEPPAGTPPAATAPASTPPATPPPTAVKDPFFLHLNGIFNAYTYLGPLGDKPAESLTPEERISIAEQVGFGYYVHQYVRVQLTLQFGETLTGLPKGTSGFALAGAIPWAVFTYHGFWTGAGPFLAGRSSSITHFDTGVYFATGWAFPLGAGLSLSPAVSMLSLLYQRVVVTVNPVICLGYRF